MISMRAARNDQNLTIEDMANILGVCKNTIINWEKGKKTPSPEQFIAYCNACRWNSSSVWYGDGFILTRPSTKSKWTD